MGLSENSVPLNPMVLLIIIPMKNGYFIGNIPYFQTNPYIYIYTLLLFNIAMENGPFIVDVPIKTSIYKGSSMAMLNNQMVYIYIYVLFSCIIHVYIVCAYSDL